MLRLSSHEYLYFLLYHTLVCYFCVIFRCLVSTPNCLPCVVLGFHMSVSSLPYIGFGNGASHSTHNLASVAWEIYAPTNELISLHGVCLGCATNNIMEYNAVIELLTNVVSLGIRHLVVRLDSRLVVLKLSNVYAIQSSTLLRVYLQICLLERYFDYIEYHHIPRCLNTLTDTLANYVLDIHLRHL
jgi:ribonuclease HI